MAHVKKMVLHGFKSFAKRTEIIFDKGINVVVGPNGSGKSNIMDALCFVLGRLSIKSMRAAKAKNMIFMGSKYVKPAKEASVEIVFDNSDKAFALETGEVSVKRIVRMNGQGIYKLNDETKTRAEIIEILAHAGIDPYGFNLILQGEIQNIVKMHGEERRKIIEEVAGISVYESRKERALKEMEKTAERLKEISTILRERAAYMNNLEKEKAQAQRYQELKMTAKRCRASIVKKKLDEKRREIEKIVNSIEEKVVFRNKGREKVEILQKKIEEIGEKINQINRHIQKATGTEQGMLREEITNFRADLEGLNVRQEGYENKKAEIEKRIEEMKKDIPELEEEIKELREQSPLMAKKAKDLKKKKEDLAELENERKKILTLKSELSSLRARREDKERQLARAVAESESLIGQIDEISGELNYKNGEECFRTIKKLRSELGENKELLEKLSRKELELEKICSVSEAEIERNEEVKGKIEKIDTCPLCQSKMTESHINHVFKDCDGKIEKAREKSELALKELGEIKNEREKLLGKVTELEKKIYSSEKELNVHKMIEEKTKLIKSSAEYEKVLRGEIGELEKKRSSLEKKSVDLSSVEAKYEEKIHEIEEISSRTEEDIDTTLLYKERELEKLKSIVKRSGEDLQEIGEQINEISEQIKEKEKLLEEKEEKEEQMNEKFNKMFEERDKMQKQIQEENIRLTNIQNEVRQIEDQVNYLKIGKAKLGGEKETLEIDIEDYHGIEILQGSVNFLEEKLRKVQGILENIGSINMRALEVYDQVKKEYDIVKEKVDILTQEREEIM
ncbi:hypothetical protein DRJ16_04685, partial [Candidatus Woesearchaeota archaeon]